MRRLVFVFICLFATLTGLAVSAQDYARVAGAAARALDWHMSNGRARQAFEMLPKGGDIHTHLRGAIYAETWLDWAAEDGLCVDPTVPAIMFKKASTCEANDWITADIARSDAYYRSLVIDGLSTRSYVPTNGWTGHDQFFETFNRINVAPHRLGDQLAAVAERAGKQNILYLELMETLVLPELFPLVAGGQFTGDVAADYKTLMEGAFGREVDTLVASIRRQIADAMTKKDLLLACGTAHPSAGCDVEIRFLHQVIREFEPAMVYAQIALGWAVMEQVPQVVGLNLVAPEDGFVALRDYTYHMQMIDHLYTTRGPQNVTLHAGELALGLVRPKQLTFHIRQAIDLGHAKRIGHGVAIAYEDDPDSLLQKMIDQSIAVEINLTSNATILGVEGGDHPIVLYRDLGVPYTINTDDEGVSRIDLTHEYIRLAQTYGVGYFELRHVSRNALTHSFLDGKSIWESDVCREDIYNTDVPSAACKQLIDMSDKARLQWKLEQKLRAFEAHLKVPKREIKSFE